MLRELSVLTTLSQSVMSQWVCHPQMLSNFGCAVSAISTPFKLNLRAIEVKISNYFRKNNQTCIHIHIQHSKKDYFGCFVVFQSVTGQNIDVQIAAKFKHFLNFSHNSIDKTVTFHKKFANRILKVTKCVTGLRNSNQTFHNTTLTNKR